MSEYELSHDLSDRDQTAADADQTAADLDQTLSDTDQEAADRDQRAADRDQQSADRDQASSERTHTADDDRDRADASRSEQDRALSAHERELSTDVRSETTSRRDANAARRDRVADQRDAAALARDRLAATIDAELELLERERAAGHVGREPAGADLALAVAEARRRAAASRERAAAQREAAARDRQQAAEDRQQAARDRRAAAEALVREGTDHLTGALGRRTGLVAIRREMARTARFGEPLVMAFVDVDGLKTTNDTLGHPAGDRVLRATAKCIGEGLRAYDVVMRFGGDEFVCTLAGLDTAGARKRFDQIAARLAASTDGQTITVGFAERRAQDSLNELIARADEAMIEARAVRRRAADNGGPRFTAGGARAARIEQPDRADDG